VPETTPPRAATATEARRSSAARTLTQDVRDALEDLYPPEQRQQWLDRYALACRRNRAAMIFFALREAGYPIR